jgi:hypothetical protein
MDWKSACLSCGQQCCRGERIFLDSTDQARLQNFFVCTNEQEVCPQLFQVGCRIYSLRPTECRIFPLDFKRIDGELWLVLWECPAHTLVDEDMIQRAIKLPSPYIDQYVAHYQNGDLDPKKYGRAWTWHQLRRVS